MLGCLGVSVARRWGLLRASWGHLGAFLGHPGRSWPHPLSHFGVTARPSWAISPGARYGT
eukprot:2687795-Pyramimonas_sp.AAC.1